MTAGEKRLVNIIVVFPKKEVAVKIKNILVKNGFDVVAVCVTGAQAIHITEDMEAGIIVSGVRFVDMVYHELKDYLPDMFEMIVVANHNQWQQYGEDDAIYLPLPMKVYDLVDTVEDLLVSLDRRLKKSKSRAKQRSSDEQGIIDQAKQLLMNHQGYTEEEAHRYLQKRSMDSGNNMVETAYMVLDMF